MKTFSNEENMKDIFMIWKTIREAIGSFIIAQSLWWKPKVQNHSFTNIAGG